jgi:hypothetical protein
MLYKILGREKSNIGTERVAMGGDSYSKSLYHHYEKRNLTRTHDSVSHCPCSGRCHK